MSHCVLPSSKWKLNFDLEHSYTQRTPRKQQITAVPVEAPVEEGLAKAWGDEVKTDVQEVTELVNELKVDEEPAVTCEVEDNPNPVAKPKARAKRAPKKPVEVEAVVEPEPVEEPQQVEEPDDGNWTKVESKVACPDCGKQMSAKTLKYSHGPNCTAKKQKRSPREISSSVIEEVIENEVQKRFTSSRALRAARRQEMVEKLLQNAF